MEGPEAGTGEERETDLVGGGEEWELKKCGCRVGLHRTRTELRTVDNEPDILIRQMRP